MHGMGVVHDILICSPPSHRATRTTLQYTCDSELFQQHQPGLLVEAEFPHITSIGCTAHSLDLALESIGKLPWAAKVIAEGKSVSKFITNHQWALALQRAKSKVEGGSKLELLKLGTRQAHMQFVWKSAHVVYACKSLEG